MNRRLYLFLFFFALLGLDFIVNGRFLNEFFFRDDFTWLENAMLSSQNIGNIFTLNIAHFFRPLVHLAMLGQYLAFGLNPTGYHVVSLLLHWVNAILLFYFLKNVIQIKHPFFLIGVPTLWITHFIHYEAVAWISALADLMLMAFFMMIFLALQKKRFGLFIMAYMGAILTKETSIALFPLIFMGLWVMQKQSFKTLIKSKEILMTGVIFIIYFIGQIKLQASAPLVDEGGFKIGLNFFTSLSERLAMLFGDFQPPVNMLVTTFILLLFLGGYMLFRLQEDFKRPFIFLLSFLLLTILPTIFVVTSIPPSRYFYLPSVAASAIIILLLLGIFQAKRLYQGLTIIGLSILILGHLSLASETEKAIQDVSEPGREFIQKTSEYIMENSEATFNFIHPPFDQAHAMSLMNIYFDIPHEQVLFNQEANEDYVNFNWN